MLSRCFISCSGLANQPVSHASRHTLLSERFWDTQLDLCCRRWRPAKLRGHSVSPAWSRISFRRQLPHLNQERQQTLLIGRKAARDVSARKFPLVPSNQRKRISQTLPSLHTPSRTDGLQQAWINSRNLTNIATQSKHRQLIFLHPTLAAGEIGNGARVRRTTLRKTRFAILLNSSCFSKLQVFHSIEDAPAAQPRGGERVHGKIAFESIFVVDLCDLLRGAASGMWRP